MNLSTLHRCNAFLVVAMVGMVISGCRSQVSSAKVSPSPVPNIRVSSIQFPDIEIDDPIEFQDAAPRSSLTEIPEEFRELSLDDAILLALQDTEILRSLGAIVVQNPQAAPGSFDPAIQVTDPNFGIEAALAQFDTQFNASTIYQRNDDVFNNPVLAGGVGSAAEVRDDLTTSIFSLGKTTATGTQFAVNSSIQHSQSNNPNLLFPHSWTTVWEATARQPLLQGSGIQFNRIAGPVRQPGFQQTSGVIISQINRDISIAQFEQNLRNMVNEIVQAYWQLDLAYKNFESIRRVRDASLTTWNIAKSRFDNDLPGGEADREAQAREQYYDFQSQLLAALNGSAQTGQVGILQAEANLRRLLKLRQSDEHLLKPADEPLLSQTVFNWKDLSSNALNARVELREQQWRIKQRKLEIIAARNFLLPRLDALATYRNNGFGDDLAGGGGRFSSALNDAFTNDHGEWEIGLTYDMTIGFRQAHAGVRNAELAMQREKAVLKEQQRQILHDLGSAVRQVDQNYSNIELQFNRLDAARNTVSARIAAYEADTVGFDELLDAQQRLLQSELAYYQATTGYELAKNELLNQSGRLLQEYGVNLAEECSECLEKF